MPASSGDVVSSDRFNLATSIMVVLGMGSLYPWTFFTTAADYFRFAFRNTTDPTQVTAYQSFFESSLTIVATACGVLGMLLNSFLTPRTSFQRRVTICFVVILITFVETTIVASVETESWQSAYFALSLVNVFILNLAGNCLLGGLYGLSSLSVSRHPCDELSDVLAGVQGCLPSRFATALMVGLTLSGIFAVLANVAAIVIERGESDLDSAYRTQGIGYFGSAVGATLLSLVAFRVFVKLPIVTHYLNHASAVKEESLIEEKQASNPKPTLNLVSLRTILRYTWKYHVIALINFAVTLAVFPAVISSVRSTHPDPNSIITTDLFTPIACFLMVNVSDLAGRLSHGFIQYPDSQQSTVSLMLAVFRIVLIPLLFYCNVQPRAHTTSALGDASFVTLVTVLAFSNGYLGNLAVMYAPKMVPEAYVELCGSLIGLVINVGLFTGSALSFILLAVV